jgi:hypothetical protein
VDDDDAIRDMMNDAGDKGFEVVAAANVPDALRLIATESFDALITDWHMLHAGEGFTAVRHSQPAAVTLLVSGYPDVRRTMAAILLKEDEIIVKTAIWNPAAPYEPSGFQLAAARRDGDRGRSGFSVVPIDGQLHEAHAQNGSVAGLLRFRAIGNKLRRGLRSFFSHR